MGSLPQAVGPDAMGVAAHKTRRPTRFYFLSIWNELLLRKYIRDAIEPSRSYARVYRQLFRHSVMTWVCEHSIENFSALWKGMFEGMALEVPVTEDHLDIDRSHELVSPKEATVRP